MDVKKGIEFIVFIEDTRTTDLLGKEGICGHLDGIMDVEIT